MPKNKDDDVTFDYPVLKRAGAPLGNLNAKKGIEEQDNAKVKTPTPKRGGNSRAYWIGRLKRDAPLHFQLFKDGAYKSVTEAAVRAGIKKKRLSKYERFCEQTNKLSLNELEHASYLINSKIKQLEQMCTPYFQIRALHRTIWSKDEIIVYDWLDERPREGRTTYVSEGKKLINFNKKYGENIEKQYDDSNWSEGFKNQNYGVIYADMVRGDLSKVEFDNYAEKYGFPKCTRMIAIRAMFNFKKKYFLDFKEFELLEGSDQPPLGNIKERFIQAVQNELERVSGGMK